MWQKNILTMPLFEAEGETSGASSEAEGAGETKKEKVVFSDEQQAYINKLIDGAYAKAYQKAETKIKQEQELSALEGEEKLKKEREIFESEKKELETAKLRADTEKLLIKSGLYLDGENDETNALLVGIVTGEDVEKTAKNVDAIKALIDKFTASEVSKKLGESAGGFKGSPNHDADPFMQGFGKK